jgi:hypothetical protein
MSDDDNDSDSEESPQAYLFSKRDRSIVSAAILFLEKIAHASFTRPAELVSVAKTLHVLKCLPHVLTADFNLRIELCGPTRCFGPHAISHSWCVEIEDRFIRISSHGYFSREATGGDSFTSMQWSAAPGEDANLDDYLEHLALVDDAKPFPAEIEALALSEQDYSLSVADDDNPLLEEMDLSSDHR